MDVETKYIIAVIVILIAGALLSKVANGGVGGKNSGSSKSNSTTSQSTSKESES